MKRFEFNYHVLVLALAIVTTTTAQHDSPIVAEAIKSITTCGETLTTAQGVIHTPNFPQTFPVPIHCTWIIDASEHNKPNSSIIVYLTQQFVLGGLKFTEYVYYKDGFKVPSDHKPFELNDQTVTDVSWIQFYSPFLEIQFTMENVYGTHLSALDRLLDVYGFNITYEITDTVKPYQCNALLCRYLGHCYATQDFSSYYCSCFPGFSGSDCGIGPLCHDGDKNFCENGGICKQIGDAGVTCLCPEGFKGRKCQIAEDISGCFSNDENCDSECRSSGPEYDRCKCTRSTSISNNERARFEASVRLGNSSYNDNRRIFPDTEVRIQFFGVKQDESRVRDAFRKLVERGRLGNLTLLPSSLSFRDEAVLQIQSVSVNYKTAVRHNADFILSCTAFGSPAMIFRWYKNGIYVNQTRATRKIWSRLYENAQSKDQYTAELGVPKANRLDEGIYTCQVSDYGMQHCRSTVVHISAKPELRLDPPSATVFRGESVRIRCLSSEIDQSNGYSWTKNNALFHSDAETELWEDLYPNGSILKINNIQKSANYTCISSNSMGQVSKSVYVYVVDKGAIELCANESTFGVNWPASSPGSPILAECPKRYEGQSQRICEQRDFGKPVWLTPNFADCLANTLVDVYNEFRGLTFGYQKTNGSVLLKSCLEYAKSRNSNFLPGEAGFLLKLLQEQVETLQELVKSATLKRELITSPPAPVPAPSTSLHYHQTGSFWTHKQHIKALPFTSQVNGDHLFNDQLYMKMATTPQLQEIISNGSMMLSVISYKNLTNFLPRIYFERSHHAQDVDYMTASRVIASWLVYANRIFDEEVVPSSRLLHLPISSAHVEIIFQHENPPNSDWTPVCGYDLQATYKATWNTDLCITENLMENVTRCVCPLSGTYIVLMAKRNYNAAAVASCSRASHLYNRKCSVTFLKMQFSTAISAAMALFTLGFLKLLPQDWNGVISSGLSGILLLGSPTLIAITLAIDSEMEPRKSPTAHLSSGIRSAIGLSWFIPMLYVVITLLVHTIMGEWPANWWMTANTFGFVLFVIIEILFVLLFSLLFYTSLQKLKFLTKKHDKHSIVLTKRLGLAYRVMCLLLLKISTDISYLIYFNSDDILFSYIFGGLSICLGFTLMVYFVIKAEPKKKFDALNKSNGKQIIDDYCSGSVNSPLNFYTNHEIGKENDCAVPQSQASNKMPLAITTRRYPMEHPPSTANITDPYITTGGLCETTFLELNDPSANLDVNFIEFKQQQQQQPTTNPQQTVNSQHHAVVQQQQPPSQYPTLLDARNYEMEIIPTDLSLYGSSCKPSQGKCYLSDTNDFVGVSSLDILQGVRQDSIVGIRSNYGVNDQIINADIKTDLSIIPASSSGMASSPHTFVNQTPAMRFASNSSPQKHAGNNAAAIDTNTSIVPVVTLKTMPPIITVTPTDERGKHIDGMLDQISLDLDYLLNRTTDIPPAPPPPISSHPKLSVHEVIIEEESEGT